MRRILCLHMPHFVTERAKRDAWPSDSAPQTDRADASLVLTRPAGATLVVAEACPRARQHGIRPGVSLGQAQALLPSLVALPHDARGDQAALERLAAWALCLSPLVEPAAPCTLLLEVTGCERLFGWEKNIAHQAIRGLAQRGFSARAAIADTPGAAYAVAAFGAEPVSIVPVGHGSAWLAPLPPAALRIDPSIAESFDALGVRTIGDLLMLPRSTLPSRFGPQLVRRLQQALGETFESLAARAPEEAPFARLAFEGPVLEPAPIQTAAESLLARVMEQVRRRSCALRRLDCVLYHEGVPPRVVVIDLARASREEAHVVRLLAERFEQMDLSPGVVGLMIVARQTAHFRGLQGDLFEPHAPGDDEAFGQLIDRLAGRLGHAALVQPQLVEDYQPERAFRYVPVTQSGGEPGEIAAVASDPAASNPSSRDDLPRPLRLFARPVPVRVMALVPDGPPTWFAHRGEEHVVVHAAGPERLETGWWRGPDVRRDYYRVVTAAGAHCWLFCALNERQWYLHGYFT